MENLRQRILSLKVPVTVGNNGKDPKKYFIPEGALRRLLSSPEVQNEIPTILQNAKIEFFRQTEFLNTINAGGYKIFGILVVTNQIQYITNFIETDQFLNRELDSRIPLLKIGDIEAIIPCVKGATEFCKTQWMFVAPVFDDDRSHRRLHDLAVLPFLKSEPLGRGGFGSVFKVTLNQDHQNLGTTVVARKEVDGINAKDFDPENRIEIEAEGGDPETQGTPLDTPVEDVDPEQEVKILSMLRCLRHPNILRLYTSYTYNGRHSLLFPVAEGDLASFFANERPPQFKYDYQILWGLYNLSSAIEKVHNYESTEHDVRRIGCHHDLKPKNILVSGNKFILSDFGLSRLDDRSKSKRRLEGDYVAPECERHIDGNWVTKSVGRASDIWSFGCILAEMATFILQKSKGVAEFKKKRRRQHSSWVFHTFHANGQVHTEVVSWLKGLVEDSANSMKRLVRDANHMMELDEDDRPNAEEVKRALFVVSQQCLFEFCYGHFDALRGISDGLELQIEWQRFQLWGWAAGFPTEELELLSEGEWMESVEGKSETLENILLELKEEIDSVQSTLKDNDVLRPIFYQLRTLNDKLWDFPPRHLTQRMGNILESRMLNTDDLRAAEETFKDHPAYGKIALLAAIKNMTSILEIWDGKDELLPCKPTLNHEEGLGSHKLGELLVDRNLIPVVVERMVYELVWINRESELVSRVDAIAKLSRATKPASFRTLRCIGFYHDIPEHCFGLVYEFPPPCATYAQKPITLKYFMDTTDSSRHTRPLLGDRFALANSLVRCVLEVHKVDWLHKNISAYNVVFFTDPSQPYQAPMHAPYLIGFNHSRPDKITAFTQGPSTDPSLMGYQHPDYKLGQRFLPKYDYYSLGMVLLEIGAWRSLEKLISAARMETLSVSELGSKLMKYYSAILGSGMGAIYRDAVQACFEGEFSDIDEHPDSFQNKVAHNLSKCFA
ncbi:kinase-like domain-containing protein [Trichophaea hybrida]|nr:kinase-like domain-containing protein [Trichophaea hybrida]